METVVEQLDTGDAVQAARRKVVLNKPTSPTSREARTKAPAQDVEGTRDISPPRNLRLKAAAAAVSCVVKLSSDDLEPTAEANDGKVGKHAKVKEPRRKVALRTKEEEKDEHELEYYSLEKPLLNRKKKNGGINLLGQIKRSDSSEGDHKPNNLLGNMAAMLDRDERDVTGEETFEWMVTIELPITEKKDRNGCLEETEVCMNGCKSPRGWGFAKVTHVCRQCCNWLCEQCMDEHRATRQTRGHELGTSEQLRVSRLQYNNGWNTRGMALLGLVEDDETLKNLGKKYPSRTAPEVVDAETNEIQIGTSGATLAVMPTSSDFFNPPRRPISPLFRRKGADSPDGSFRRPKPSSASSTKKLESSTDIEIDVKGFETAALDSAGKISRVSSSASDWAREPENFWDTLDAQLPAGRSFHKNNGNDNHGQQHQKGRPSEYHSGYSRFDDEQMLDRESTSTQDSGVARRRKGGVTASMPNIFSSVTVRPTSDPNGERQEVTVGSAGVRLRSISPVWGRRPSMADLKRPDQLTVLTKKERSVSPTWGRRASMADLRQPSTDLTKAASSVTDENIDTEKDVFAGKTRSFSPSARGMAMATIKSSSQFSMSLGSVRQSEQPGAGKFLQNACSKPMSDPSEYTEDGPQEMTDQRQVPENLRRAMGHFFINEQMQTSGFKAFFEYRSNPNHPGIKMFAELDERHLFVSRGDDITRPTHKIHLLELCLMPEQDIIGLPPFLLILTPETPAGLVQVFQTSFQGGSSFICFKNSSEVKAWGNKIRENIAELNNLPLKEQFFKDELMVNRDPVEGDCVTLQNLLDEEKLKPYNNTKAIVREIVYTKRDGIVNIKWGVELKTGKTVKLSRDKMVVMREPLTPTQMKELHEKGTGIIAALKVKVAKSTTSSSLQSMSGIRRRGITGSATMPASEMAEFIEKHQKPASAPEPLRPTRTKLESPM